MRGGLFPFAGSDEEQVQPWEDKGQWPSRWVSHSFYNGISVYREQQKDGGAYMCSVVIRSSPNEVYKAVQKFEVGFNSILKNITVLESFKGENTQVWVPWSQPLLSCLASRLRFYIASASTSSLLFRMVLLPDSSLPLLFIVLSSLLTPLSRRSSTAKFVLKASQLRSLACVTLSLSAAGAWRTMAPM